MPVYKQLFTSACILTSFVTEVARSSRWYVIGVQSERYSSMGDPVCDSTGVYSHSDPIRRSACTIIVVLICCIDVHACRMNDPA